MEINKEFDPTDLILKVRLRDDEAFAELVRRYTPMLNKVIAGFNLDEARAEEALSEACVALHRAALSYDLSSEEVTFGLYSRICVYRRLCDFVGRMKKDELLVELDADAIVVPSSIENSLVRRERMQETLTFARSVLSEYEYKVLLLYLQGYTTSAIAKELSKTKKSVDNAKARMITHLRRAKEGFPQFD